MKNTKEIRKIKQEINKVENECREKFKAEHCKGSCDNCEIFIRKKKLTRKLKALERDPHVFLDDFDD